VRVLGTLFVFATLFCSLGVMTVQALEGVNVDPRLLTLVAIALGVFMSMLSNYQGGLNVVRRIADLNDDGRD